MRDAVVADDGCRLWTAVAGDGTPLVFCHGGPGLWDMFGDVVEMFAGAARTVRWDQRGCGRSERRGPYTIARSIADLDAVCRRAAGPWPVLFGHSWGASLALRYALDHPDRVAGLIYVAGTGIDPEPTWRPGFEANLRARLGPRLPRWEALRATAGRTPDEDRELAVLQWSAEFADPRTARGHAERMATPWFGINQECNATLNAEVRHYLATTDVAARCRALDTPTLILDGADDIRPRWAVDSLHRALPAARRVTLAGAGHLPWVEDPDGFRDAVRTAPRFARRRRDRTG